jgi:16S rRNA (cytidine1402-2'-O)-methyltransferase
MSVQLFIVATPIGNLDDISRRAIKTLQQVDLVAAEDTRHSKRLLNHLGIRQEMVSLHEHNERQRIAMILQQLEEGRSVALISDAGTPLISDPGYPLVRAVAEAGYRITPIPGACSVIAALSAAGLPTDRFTFHGFLPQKNAERLNRLDELGQLGGTQVLLESTHRIVRLMQQVETQLPQAEVVLAKELTKAHERMLRGSAADCLQALLDEPPLQKGEFVVLLHLPRVADTARMVLNSEKLLGLLIAHLPLKTAVSLVAEISGEKKNRLYDLALRLRADQD